MRERQASEMLRFSENVRMYCLLIGSPQNERYLRSFLVMYCAPKSRLFIHIPPMLYVYMLHQRACKAYCIASSCQRYARVCHRRCSIENRCVLYLNLHRIFQHWSGCSFFLVLFRRAIIFVTVNLSYRDLPFNKPGVASRNCPDSPDLASFNSIMHISLVFY